MPKVLKRPWTDDEDEIILGLVQRHGPRRWNTLANYVPGRCGKQCRERWMNHLRPEIKNEPWSVAEDLILTEGVVTYGTKWTKIVENLPGRSDNSAKNRWNSKLKTCRSQSSDEVKSNTESNDEVSIASECGKVISRAVGESRTTNVSKRVRCPDKMSISFILN
mmetsp:Transcript_5246/g.9170  ORF Transcript_5246/g.9170 Transcript_5246/m.9170 type:complete len:164 (-) Transcript_5246:903-1394(-)